jgi:hypothetical protein
MAQPGTAQPSNPAATTALIQLDTGILFHPGRIRR